MVWAYFGEKKTKQKKKDCDLCYATFHGKPSGSASVPHSRAGGGVGEQGPERHLRLRGSQNAALLQ